MICTPMHAISSIFVFSHISYWSLNINSEFSFGYKLFSGMFYGIYVRTTAKNPYIYM